jgi:hypothetical protein
MMHIVDYNGDDDAYFLMRLSDQADRDSERHGACDDDCEVTAPFIGILPDESEQEDGSPLRFKADPELISIMGGSEAAIDSQIQEAFERGLP